LDLRRGDLVTIGLAGRLRQGASGSATFGRLDDGSMVAVNRALALFLGFA
jgi:hypothetical protein